MARQASFLSAKESKQAPATRLPLTCLLPRCSPRPGPPPGPTTRAPTLEVRLPVEGEELQVWLIHIHLPAVGVHPLGVRVHGGRGGWRVEAHILAACCLAQQVGVRVGMQRSDLQGDSMGTGMRGSMGARTGDEGTRGTFRGKIGTKRLVVVSP